MARWKIRPAGSNWGDFGENDQHGRMNLLTPERRLAGVREVREGIAFSLSLPLDYPGGAELAPPRSPPVLSSAGMNLRLSSINPEWRDVICDDAVLIHLQYSTQWDSLAHVGCEFDADGDGVAEAVYYNGYRAGTHVLGPDEGGPKANALGIENLAVTGAQGRGVLVDLHAIYGREHAKVGYDAFMAALDEQKVSVHPGDFLCLYTGFGDMLLEMNKSPDVPLLQRSCPGLDGDDERLLQWITDSGIVALCADNLAVEWLAAPDWHRGAVIPMHQHCLFKLGIHLGELWYFTELARWLAAHGRSAFLLTAPPLRLPGAVGSPATPIATV